MATSSQELKNQLAAYQIYGGGILVSTVVEEVFAVAIAKAEAGEAVPAEAPADEVVPAAPKRTRKQAE